MTTPRYAYDPELLPFASLLPAVTDFSDPNVLAQMRGPRPEIFGTPPPDRDDVSKRDRRVPGRAGDPDVPIRIYAPKVEGSGPRGCVVEIHGGGFMMGSIAMMDPWCQVVAARHDAVVVSVEYRLAPEHPFPAALEDCYAALCFTAAHAVELGVDPSRIAIAGQSAGGGLAAATALLARDRGGPALCFQLLDIPELDDRLDTPSMRAFTDTPLWNRPNAVWSWRHYLGAGHTGEVSPYAAPARMQDLSKLPPAYVSAMEFDPLRDEGIDYALRMLQAGVPVELHSFPGTFHGSALIAGAEVSQRAAAESLAALGRALRRTAA
jgi:acetyl esterase/lipase